MSSSKEDISLTNQAVECLTIPRKDPDGPISDVNPEQFVVITGPSKGEVLGRATMMASGLKELGLTETLETGRSYVVDWTHMEGIQRDGEIGPGVFIMSDYGTRYHSPACTDYKQCFGHQQLTPWTGFEQISGINSRCSLKLEDSFNHRDDRTGHGNLARAVYDNANHPFWRTSSSTTGETLAQSGTIGHQNIYMGRMMIRMTNDGQEVIEMDVRPRGVTRYYRSDETSPLHRGWSREEELTQGSPSKKSKKSILWKGLKNPKKPKGSEASKEAKRSDIAIASDDIEEVLEQSFIAELDEQGGEYTIDELERLWNGSRQAGVARMIPGMEQSVLSRLERVLIERTEREDTISAQDSSPCSSAGASTVLPSSYSAQTSTSPPTTVINVRTSSASGHSGAPTDGEGAPRYDKGRHSMD